VESLLAPGCWLLGPSRTGGVRRTNWRFEPDGVRGARPLVRSTDGRDGGGTVACFLVRAGVQAIRLYQHPSDPEVLTGGQNGFRRQPNGFTRRSNEFDPEAERIGPDAKRIDPHSKRIDP